MNDGGLVGRKDTESYFTTQSKFPKSIVTPTEVHTQSYLDIASLLKRPPLLTDKSLKRFRSAAKLNLMDNKF